MGRLNNFTLAPAPDISVKAQSNSVDSTSSVMEAPAPSFVAPKTVVKTPKIPKTMSSVLNLIYDKAKKFGVPESLAAGLIEHESGGRQTVNGKTLKNPNYPAYGISQIDENTAKRFGVTDIHNTEQNLEGGLKNLAHWIKVYDGNVDKALAKYGGYGGDTKKAAKYITRVKDYAEKYNIETQDKVDISLQKQKGVSALSIGKNPIPQEAPAPLSEGAEFRQRLGKSAVKTAIGVVATPVVVLKANTELMNGNPQPAADVIKGLIHFVGDPTGISDIAQSLVDDGKLVPEKFTQFRNAWHNDPVGAVLGVLPFVKGGLSTVVESAKAYKGGLAGTDIVPTKTNIEIAAENKNLGKLARQDSEIKKRLIKERATPEKSVVQEAPAPLIVKTPSMSFEQAKTILTNKSQHTDIEIKSALDFIASKESKLSKAVKEGAVNKVGDLTIGQLQTMATKGEDIVAPIRKAIIDKTITKAQAEDLWGRTLSGSINLAKTTAERETIFEHLKVQDANMRDVIKNVKVGTSQPQGTGAQGEITELNMGINPFTGFKNLDKLIGKGVSALLDKTGADKFIRIFANPDGLRYMPREAMKSFKELYYSKLKGQVAKGEFTSEALRDSLTPEMKKGLQDATIIRYLEEPKFRAAYDQTQPNNPIKPIADALAKGSEELMSRGIILPSAHTKWGDRFLSRTYLAFFGKEHGGMGASGIKGEKIQQGRTIASIMDIPFEERSKLGYVEDADQNIALSLFKQSKNIAIDDFTRGIVKDPQLMGGDSFLYSVVLPKSLNVTGNLPEIMSPYYARTNIVPFLKEAYQAGKISKNQFKEFIKEIKIRKEALDALHKQPIPKGTTLLGQDSRYGVLSGMPVNKDIGNLMNSLNVFNNPAEMASNLDKFMTALTATFKWVKVPGNVPKTLGRNAITNIGQWMMSGANPVAFATYLPRGIIHAVQKSKHWITANENGLFKSNFTDEEVTRLFRELHDSTAKDGYKGLYAKWAKIMNAAPISTMSNAYSVIDDVWKMSRYLYGIEKEGLSATDAVIKAQETHFDYSLTYNLIRGMRDANIQKSPAWKLLGSLFPTFSQKVLGALYEAFRARPLTAVGLVALPVVVASAINEKQRKKYGVAYTKLMNSIPTYLKDPATIGVYNKDRKTFEIVNISWLLPWGQWQNLVTSVAEGELKQGAKSLGLMSSPLYTPMAIWNNKNPFTDQEISDPTQTLPKRTVQSAGYLAETFLEPGIATFARKTLTGKQSLKQSALQSVGIPYYEFSPKVLKMFSDARDKRIDMEVNIRLGKLKRQYKSGDITGEKYNSEKKRLERVKKTMKAKN